MKTIKLLFLSLFVVTSFSCSSDDDDPIQDNSLKLSDLEGSWKATSSMHVNNSNASETFDLIANGGEIRYTMLTGGRVRTWVNFGDFNDEWDAQATLNGDILTTIPVESSRGTSTFKVTKSGNTVTLINTSDKFDFTLTGDTPVSSTSTSILVPNN